jgi:hypothetical protein
MAMTRNTAWVATPLCATWPAMSRSRREVCRRVCDICPSRFERPNGPYTDVHCTALTFSDTGTFLGDTAGTEFNGQLDMTGSYFDNFGSWDDGPALGSITLTRSEGSATPRNHPRNRHPIPVDRRPNRLVGKKRGKPARFSLVAANRAGRANIRR